MKFATPLLPATLIRRYKRFLADISLEDGSEAVAHCPNPGSMLGMADEGMRIWVERNDDPKKKLRYGWRLIEQNGVFIGVDTGAANKIIKEALQARLIPELSTYDSLRAEVKYGTNSRVDFLLDDIYVEVKSVTLSRQKGLAEFPDCVTARGAKHLAELSEMVAQGKRAVMLFLVQRTDCDRFDLARDLDVKYGQAFEAAREAGVETLCYDVRMTPDEIVLGTRLVMAR